MKKLMKRRRLSIIGAALLSGSMLLAKDIAQTPTASAPGPYARIAIMRARDESHTFDMEAGYIRHLEWHRQAKDTFGWYSYSVSSSAERQRWIIYATFGHTAAELSNPLSPAEDERDSTINVVPHVQFLGNWIYEFLPVLSHGTGVPTPSLRAEYTTVQLRYGAGKRFEEAIAARQSKLRGETLWYRLIAGGEMPCYVRIRPRANLA